MPLPICIFSPNCHRINIFHWREFSHPGQSEPAPKPDISTWLSSEMKSNTDETEKKGKTFLNVTSAPEKSKQELVPETLRKTSPHPYRCNGNKRRVKAVLESSEDESRPDAADGYFASMKRSRALLVIDDVEDGSANLKHFSSTASAIVVDEEVEYCGQTEVDVAEKGNGGEENVEGCGNTSIVDVDGEKGGDDEVSFESVNSLLTRCEEVGEGLKKQVKLAVVEQPKCVGSESLRLKKYQLVGLTWLNNLHMQGVNGILADEMGLGKTIQSIAFLGHLRSSGILGPHIIVCPASTLENWKRELNMWLPSANCTVYHGTQKEREAIRRVIRENDELDVMLTTYSYFQSESAKQDRAYLRRFEFQCMVLDEGHSMKNSEATRSRRLMQLTYKWCVLLTGTPINNNVPELLALLQFVMPSFFDGEGLEELQESCENFDKRGPLSQDASKLVERIRIIMTPFILRRRKADVLSELVAKVESVHMIDISAMQRRIYDDVIARWKGERAARHGKSSKGGKAVNSLFTELRKVANHPLLVRSLVSEDDLEIIARELHRKEHFGDQCSLEMVLKEIQAFNDFDISQVCAPYKTLARFVLSAKEISASAKFDCISSILEKSRNGKHRALIFSQWTSMLDLLECFLENNGISFLRLDGSTAVKERQALIDEFNRDSSILVFLLSTRAGGLGINLTAADTVILHDLDFNPQSDRQAEDRCHRIGQLRPVHVHRLVARETVDENIFMIADRKRKLANDMLDEGDGVEDISDTSSGAGKGDTSMQTIIESCLARYLED